MGVALTLLVCECKEDLFDARTVIVTAQHQAIWKKLKKCRTVFVADVSTEFHTYFSNIEDGEHAGEGYYGPVTHDPYGSPLKFVQAGGLVQHWKPLDDGRNAPALAYLAALPAETLIGLYWN